MQGGRRGYPSHQKMGGTQEGGHLEERLNESGLHLENFRSTSKASIVFVCRVAFAFQLEGCRLPSAKNSIWLTPPIIVDVSLL